ncbi:zinc finger MYM-type protein 3-like [Clytia hemisphaerica]|uniref:zinc finger MYM-type protein 3-like n=1 Tax=Clytia hemisphaerica TaxID=252671 RepID=UPI0034D76EC1
MQAALHRHLVEQNYPKSIMSDLEFVNSRRVLEGKAKALREQGKGKKPNKSEPMIIEEEKMLWEAGKLGDSSPSSLVHTMWFLNVQHFGQRGQQEHSTMTIENFVRKIDESTGAVYIEFLENPTKTREGGLRPNQRVTNPKMFEFPSDRSRCPITLFEKYVSKRPAALKTTGRFYLSPKDDYIDSGQWYKQVPLGRNKIAGFMKSIIKDTSLEHSGKNLTN